MNQWSDFIVLTQGKKSCKICSQGLRKPIWKLVCQKLQSPELSIRPESVHYMSCHLFGLCIYFCAVLQCGCFFLVKYRDPGLGKVTGSLAARNQSKLGTAFLSHLWPLTAKGRQSLQLQRWGRLLEVQLRPSSLPKQGHFQTSQNSRVHLHSASSEATSVSGYGRWPRLLATALPQASKGAKCHLNLLTLASVNLAYWLLPMEDF